MRFTFKHFILGLLSTVLLLTPIYFAFICPPFVQVSDFGTSSYIAACLVKLGRVYDLYPDISNHVLYQSSFTNYSHQVLNSLPASQIPMFQYPPLLAFLLQPIAYLPLQAAYLLWQLISVSALGLSVFLIASVSSLNWIICFGLSILYLPVLHTLLTGQIGLILIFLPLASGYFLLRRGHPAAAGVAWSFLMLKLQFLPIVLLMITTLLFAKQWRCAAGFAVGLIILSLCNIFCLGTQTACQWLRLINISDALASSVNYSASIYLQTSLPRAVMLALPMLWRIKLRMIIYLLSLLIGAHSLVNCVRLIKKTKDYMSVMPYVFVLGIFLMPLISPHLFYYDLSIFVLAGIVIYAEPRLRSNSKLMRDLLIGWVLIDLYLITALFVNRLLAQPILLAAVLVWLYLRVLKTKQIWFAE
jgi:hypothetical protein